MTKNEKTFPLGKAALEKVIEKYTTPFYIYDEAGILENARRFLKAFRILPSFKEHFAVKALPNPAILKLLAGEGFGADCASLAELYLAEKAGIGGEAVMFTSNETPAEEYEKALSMGAVINLDDFTHIAFLDKIKKLGEISQAVSLRYNPGARKTGNAIIGNPLEAKYGLTREQIIAGFRVLRESGVRRFGLHTMVASNELNLSYHIETARMLFELAVEVQREAGVRLEFVNLGGGVGIPYTLEQVGVDYEELAVGIRGVYDAVIMPAGLDPLGVRTEWGRAITGPYGWLVSRAVHEKNIYRKYIGLDACMADLMRPALYGAYHHITVAGKEGAALDEVYDVVGSLCENNDKFAVQRALPKIAVGAAGDVVIIHDAGAHGRAMGFNYNGKLRCGELLLRRDGTVAMIRRRETLEDYFATLVEAGSAREGT